MHVVMISKACVVGTYQRKLEELARQPDMRLTVLVPPYWRDSRGLTNLERSYTSGYDLRVVPLAFNGHYHLHYYPGLSQVIRELEPGLLHVDEEPYNLATWQAMRVARSLRVAACFFTWQNIHRSYPPPFRWFERYNLAHAVGAIAGNHEAMSVLRSKGYGREVRVIPQFGVDPELFSPAASGRLDDSGELTLGYAGGLVAAKGVDVLLQALAALQPARWSLVVVGEGGERARLEALAERLGVERRVRFVGRIPSYQMPDFYRSLSALVLPSLTQRTWKEQFGRVLVEAMSCGVPVIGSDSGEIPHVIGAAGLLFPEGDVIALRERLGLLADEPELRQELARLGRRRVLEHFTQRQVADATYSMYLHMSNQEQE